MNTWCVSSNILRFVSWLLQLNPDARGDEFKIRSKDSRGLKKRTLSHRATKYGKTLTEWQSGTKGAASPLRAYRHGSYGMEIPWVLGP
jgi:hypothetical protein